MSSSSTSSKIGQCAICWSFLTSSNTFVITKCGHTFHQNCINQWITNAKTCPSCRTPVSETDVIKLFIQEYYDTTVAETSSKKDFTKYIHDGHYVKKNCKCDIIQGSNGDLRYKSISGVYIKHYKSVGIIKVTLPNEYTVTTFPCTKLEILREKTQEKSVVYPDGRRYEYFKKGIKFDVRNYFNDGDLNGLVTERSKYDIVKHYHDEIRFYYPKTAVRCLLKRGYGNAVYIKVFSSLSDSNKYLKIRICPQHGVFYVKHYDGNYGDCCTFVGKICEHFDT